MIVTQSPDPARGEVVGVTVTTQWRSAGRPRFTPDQGRASGTISTTARDCKAPSAKGRTDLCDQPALLLNSWDAENAPAIPAVHVEARQGGSRLWIHAPAVAERVGIGNNLDVWLRERGETLCLGEVWQPLLSPTLNKTVQFRVGETSAAVSACLDVDADGELLDWTFVLSNIRPVATVTRQQLQALADGNREPERSGHVEADQGLSRSDRDTAVQRTLPL